MPRQKIRESTLLLAVKQILNILEEKGLLFYKRIHVMPVLRGGYYSPNRDMNGMPDLLIWLKDGPVLSIELKAQYGKQSDQQRVFEVKVKGVGHQYYLVKTIEEFNDVLKANGITHWVLGGQEER